MKRFSLLPAVLIVQVVAIGAFAAAYSRAPGETAVRVREHWSQRRDFPTVPIARREPLRITSFYDDPELVSDEELANVLRQIQPRFAGKNLKPNYVEHALRAWGVDATFRDKSVMSGEQMVEFLVNHGKYMASWGEKTPPLLQEEPTGVSIRWGKEVGASVHHDHLLACLTEAGITLEEKVYLPNHHIRNMGDVLQQALRDFRLDERETEWSVMAYGLWLPPVKSWKNNQGRTITFNELAERQMRGALPLGVCHGTHRVYSLMVLIRLDDEFQILEDTTRAQILQHLRHVRDLIIASQMPDGHWPSNWSDGAAAVKNPVEDELFRQVIATGHHLEWLAIAPEELHPPREQIRKAARWLIDTTIKQSRSDILDKFTFFSHAGNSLALWRKTRPADYWKAWERQNPDEGTQPPPVEEPASTNTTTNSKPVEGDH